MISRLIHRLLVWIGYRCGFVYIADLDAAEYILPVDGVQADGMHYPNRWDGEEGSPNYKEWEFESESKSWLSFEAERSNLAIFEKPRLEYMIVRDLIVSGMDEQQICFYSAFTLEKVEICYPYIIEGLRQRYFLDVSSRVSRHSPTEDLDIQT